MGIDSSGTSGAWSPSFVNGSIPENFTHITEPTFAFRLGHPHNFGHVFNDNMVATVAAANMFGIDLQSDPPPRILLLENQDEFRRYSRRMKNGFKWLWGLTGRNPDMNFELPDGTCYDNIIMGHTSAFSVTYFQATASVFVRQLRSLYSSNLLLRSLYTPLPLSKSLKQEIPDGSHSYVLSVPARNRHRVIIYSKSPVMHNEPVWPDACAMIPEFRALYLVNEVEFLCVGSLSFMAVELQIQLASSASVHVMPHGGLSYLAMFASEGASVLLLTNDGFAKELQVLGQLPWLDVSVMSPMQRSMLPQILHLKLLTASHSMQLPVPVLSAAGAAFMQARATDEDAAGWEEDCSPKIMMVDGKSFVYGICE
jgi:hypothetical protein